MYIVKNAITNIKRMRGRNLVIGIIITCITMSACIALSLQKSGTGLIASYKESNPVEVTFSLMRERNGAPGAEVGTEETASTDVEKLTVSTVKKIADSDYVTGFYYTLEASLSSNDIEAVNDNDTSEETEENTNDSNNQFGGRKQMMANMGDYRLTAYSDSSYISEFIEGTKKMTTGSMFTTNDTGNEIIISEDLATENELEVGDEITFYSPEDEDTVYTFTISGIYEDNSDSDENSFMKMNVMNSRNQIYTTISAMEKVLGDEEENLGPDQGLTARFYLEKLTDVETFTKEAQSKGLDESYQVKTNEQELMETLAPIEQISKFSGIFLVVILIVGALILSVINLLHIRERKYEIGVLRSIGMSKWKVICQIICEIFIVAMVSLVVGTGIGVVLSQPVTDFVLKEQIESNETKANTAIENFGSSEFENGPGGMNRGGNRNNMNKERTSEKDVVYVDHLDVKIDAITIVELFGFSLILVLTSSFLAILNINKYEPNKILQSRN